MLTTPLIDAHTARGARLTEFAGWRMPLSFAGTTAEHHTVRQSVGVFDLCHMGRFHLSGPDALALLAHVTPSDPAALQPGRARYTVVLADSGGMVDDIIVTRWRDHFHLCVNAANRRAVWDHLARYAEGLSVTMADISADTGQIAVQGPACEGLIRPLLNGPFPRFMHAVEGGFDGTSITVSRTGYTGELGVELFAPVAVLPALWQHLLERGAAPIGLAARDTLRLEVGYPLYGHELSLDVTPVEAGLSWLVDWRRDGYLGRERLHRQRRAKTVHTLVGLAVTGRGIPREGCPVRRDGEPVGQVTSGNMGLSVGYGVALARLSANAAEPGTALTIDVRGRELAAVVTRPPFYQGGSARVQVD